MVKGNKVVNKLKKNGRVKAKLGIEFALYNLRTMITLFHNIKSNVAKGEFI